MIHPTREAKRAVRQLLLGGTLAVFTSSLVAQQTAAPAPQPGTQAPGALGQTTLRPPPPSGPAPRLADGTLDLSGLWVGGGGPFMERGGGLKRDDIPILPWVKEYLAKLDLAKDPMAFCLPMGIVRKMPYPWRIVQDQMFGKATRLYILEEGNIHTYRQIFVDGRTRPDDLLPSWMGYSIGHWEKDTLVVETTGFNGRVWLDRAGFPQTQESKITERYTRLDLGTLERVVTIDDPGAYSKPFTLRYTARLSNPEDEILEYFCTENNQYGQAGGFSAPPEFPVIAPPPGR